MKDLLLLHFKKFLERRVRPGDALLVGYSGGPDSKALLHLLCACRRFADYTVHLAHVDHGWRAESAREAELIADEAKGLGIELHLKRLGAVDFRPGNLEEQGREHRLSFFSEVYKRLDCRALLLGHHAGDQAEGVLKRILEGASLYSLGGLALEAELFGMVVWRPLIPFTKQQILNWLSEKELGYFEDATNRDLRFLRGRMRQEILPSLAQNFGKEVASNLCRLAEESREVKEYFSSLNEVILTPLLSGGGDAADFSPWLPLPRLQLKYLIKEWMAAKRCSPPRQILEGILDALSVSGPEKRFYFGEVAVFVKRSSVFVVMQEKLVFQE